MNKVALKYVENYEINEIEKGLTTALDLVGGLANFVKPKQRVMLKCTLGNKHLPDDGLSTHPNLIKVLANKITKLGATCTIVDSPNNLSTSISKIYETTQMLDASNEGDAELNSNHDIFKFDFDGKMTKKLTLIDAINDADIIINVPKLVVNQKLGLKGCLDNLFGLLPIEEQIITKSRLFDLKNYNEFLLDLHKYLKNKLVLNIVDGIVSFESNNCQRIMNALLVGENPFAVDYLTLKILNQDPKSNTLLSLATFHNIFDTNSVSSVGDGFEKFLKPDYSYPELEGNQLINSASKSKKIYKTYQARPTINTKKCKGCGVCIKTCPNRAIKEKYDKNNEMYASLDYSRCISCFRCVKACPYQVIDTINPSKNKQLNNRMSKRKRPTEN